MICSCYDDAFCDRALATSPRVKMALPFLPGNSFDTNLGRTKFHKSQLFEFRNSDVPVCVDESKPGIGGEPHLGYKPKPPTSIFPDGVGDGEPTWVAFDRQVLQFYAYFQEGVEEKREEKYRVRYCRIFFYLEDDSIQVNEQCVENSGIPQGTLIRRHRIPLPPPHDHQFYTVDHFNVGNQIYFYSKIFQITGCDEFTKNFLQKLGVRVPLPLDVPGDPYSKHREKATAAMQPLRPYEKQDTLKQFLEYDRHVLRFNCHWDDTDSMFGDAREMELHYFLADDTIELLERIPPNSGRDAVSTFLKRARLPKDLSEVRQPGINTKRTVLNVFGPSGNGNRYILDSLKTGALHTEYYYEKDLAIGTVINVWGRRIVLCDCDDFTKDFYHTKYGIDKFEPVKFSRPTPRVPQPEIPPYNGFGSEEDSFQSCQYLIPKPPRKDFVKFMEKDRQGLDSNVLRFVAKLKNPENQVDAGRLFIILYYLADDTISVFEPPRRNSGVIGGMFLQRRRVAKLRNTSSEPILYYQPEELYVGCEVMLNNFYFVLIDADEYALRYMENHSGQFPHANIHLILSKLRGPAASHVSEIKRVFTEIDPSSTGQLTYENFRGVVQHLTHGMVNEHEILTLGRQYGEKRKPPLHTLINVIQDILRKKNFTSFSKLQQVLERCDSTQSGYIDKDQLDHVCHSLGLPLSDQLIHGTVMNCWSDAAGQVKYDQFVQYMNWIDHPAVKQQNSTPAGAAGSWSGFGNDRDTVSNISYQTLLDDLVSSS